MTNQGLCLWTPLGNTVPNSNAASKTLSRKVHTTPSLLQDRILNYRHCQQVSDVVTSPTSPRGNFTDKSRRVVTL